MAHDQRPPAILPGPPLAARLRRGFCRLPPAHRHPHGRRHAGRQGERREGDRAQLHHPAPEMGHPLHLHRQPHHAHPFAGWADRVAVGDGRQEGRHRRQRLDRAVQPERGDRRARGGEPARAGRHVHDVPCAGEDRERAGLADHRPARRHPQFGDAHGAEAHAYGGRLRAAFLRLQLLRHGRLQPRRVSWWCASWPSRVARPFHPVDPVAERQRHEDPRADRDGAQPRQVHRLPHLLRHLQAGVDLAPGHGIRLVQQCRDQARHRYPKDWRTRSAGTAAGSGRRTQDRAEAGGKLSILAKIFANPNLPEIDDYYEPFTFDYEHLQKAPELPTAPVARPLSLSPAGRWRRSNGGRTGRRSWAASSTSAARTTISRRCRRTSTASSRTPS